MLTVERVRLCKRDGEMFARPQQLPMTDRHGRTLWQKLMVYTAEATALGTKLGAVALGKAIAVMVVVRTREIGAVYRVE